MVVFTTIRDLQLWVSERSGETTSAEDNEKIADAIRNMQSFPAYGEDAEDFLAELPDDLCKIIVQRFVITDGHVTEVIESDDIDCAMDYAEEKWQEGSWDEKQSIDLTVQEIGWDDKTIGESISRTIEVGEDAPVPDCCEDEHEWCAPHECVGGLKENPGVWSLGGTTMFIKTVCKHCGMYKEETHYGAQRNYGQYDTTEYSESDEDSRKWLESVATRD